MPTLFPMIFRDAIIVSLRRCRWIFLAIPLCAALAEPVEDARLRDARAELLAARQTLSEVTTPQEKGLWERRVRICEQEVANAERLIELEKRESQVSLQPKNAYQNLIEAVAAVDSDLAGSEKVVKLLGEQVEQLHSRIDDLDRQLSVKPADDRELDLAAELEQQKRNVQAEIKARSLQKEAQEVTVRMRLDGVRIRKFLQELNLSPDPTLGVILDRRRRVALVNELREGYEDNVRYFSAEKRQAELRLEVASERSRSVGSEIENLREKMQLEKATSVGADNREQRDARLRRIRTMSASVGSEKRLLDSRMASIREQIIACDAGIKQARMALDLLTRERAYLSRSYLHLRFLLLAKLGGLAGVIAGIFVVEAILAAFLLRRTVRRENVFIMRRLSRYGAFLLVVVVLTVFFLEDLRAIATVIGLATAAVVIALQDVCSSFVGWFAIVLGSKIRIGDRIQVNDMVGDVIDIQIMRTTIMECGKWLGVDAHTGRVIVLPNNFIFRGPVFNYSHVHPMVWARMDVMVTYETPYAEAMEVIRQVLAEETRESMAAFSEHDDRLTAIYPKDKDPRAVRVLSEIGASGINFILLFPADYREVSAMKQRITDGLIREFAKHPHLQFAYPTSRVVRLESEVSASK